MWYPSPVLRVYGRGVLAHCAGDDILAVRSGNGDVGRYIGRWGGYWGHLQGYGEGNCYGYILRGSFRFIFMYVIY